VDPVVIAIVVIVAVVIIGAAAFVVTRRGAQGPATPSRPAGAPTVTAPSLRDRLARSRSNLTASLGGIFSSQRVDDETWQELEDGLIAADVGPAAASEIVAEVRATNPSTGDQARLALEDVLTLFLERPDRSLDLSGHPAVVVVVGVNGTGKTTSIAKIAKHLVDDGNGVVLGAADTFRAAADTQLKTWGDRVGVPVVSGAEGADPASVAHDAYTTAVRDGADVLIVDTAGRLHSQTNLMDQLAKIGRVLDREAGEIDEVLLVLDGTVGQNGIAQARAFTDAIGVTGVVLTKLDGTARGGVTIAVERDLGVPVKLIGIGEGMDDLIPFEPRAFVEALLEP
jgi:fused signal recognition particle receptor